MAIQGYWKLDEDAATTTVADSSGQSNNGTASQNTDKFATTGKVNGAFTFTGGSADDVLISAAASINNIFSSGGSAGGWINMDTDGGGNLGRIFDKSKWLLFAADQSGNDIRVRLFQDFSGDDGTWETDRMSNGAWHHVIVTYDSSSNTNSAQFYVDGVVANTTEVGTPTGTVSSDTSDDLRIANSSAGNRNFDGELDNLRAYDSVLSALEVRYLYHNGVGTDAVTIPSVGTVSGVSSPAKINGVSSFAAVNLIPA